MSSKLRRETVRLRLEILESRTLLSVLGSTERSGPLASPALMRAQSSVMVRFDAWATATQTREALQAIGGSIVTSYPNGPSLVALPRSESVQSALAALRSEPFVAYAEADATLHAASTVIPSDPSFSQLWGLATIDAPSAWGITTGTSATIVAILDTGIDQASPDLASKLWTNPTANRDGYRGDVHGWNFVSNNGDIQDNNGHGSHVSGILAAAGNNGIGVVGVDWGAQIMPVKILDSGGNGSTDAAVSGIYWAVQHGAKVINASWGGGDYSQAMIDAINFAGANGVVFVTAAGNDSSNNDVVTTYPASYRLPNELVVAAVDRNGNLAGFSNYGASNVDIAAPGVGILSTVPGGYAVYDGTSMATPYVAGTVALLAGVHPNLTAAQLVSVVRATAKRDPALNGLTISGGIVDAYYALIGNTTGGPVRASSTAQLSPANSSAEAVEAAILAGDSAYSLAGGTDAVFVRQTFQALLGRGAFDGDVAYWTSAIQSGFSRTQVVNLLQATTEARRTRVARWYIEELGSSRTLDQLKSDPGVAYWGTLLANGSSDAAVQSALLGGFSYYQSLGSTPAAFINGLWQSLLGRPADAATIAYFTPPLQSGFSRATLVGAILKTTEGHRATTGRLFQDELGSTKTLDALKNDPAVASWAGFLGSD